jgi:hypothetical protein
MPDEMAGFDSLQVNVKSALKQSRGAECLSEAS